MDQIVIRELEVFARHGVYPEEKEKGQKFYVNVILETNVRKAGIHDELAFSTDYGEVCRFVHRFLQENTYNLIEAAVERLAEALLLEYPFVRGVTLEIRKPEAPIGLPFSSVSVKIKRKWHTVYVALGSNMGDREAYIRNAVASVEQKREIRGMRVSELLPTIPYGEVKQGEFLNGVMEFQTLLAPQELLAFLQELEREAGRERKIHWGPRTLDLDILLYDDLVMDEPELTIPHPDMVNRDFVLVPLAQIAPYVRHPVFRMTVAELLSTLEEKNVIAGLPPLPWLRRRW